MLAARGIKAEIVVHETPKVMLYVETPHAMLFAIDAETGVVRWKFPTGRPDFPSLAPAANDEFVAVVNGSRLYVVRLVDGKLVFEKQLRGAVNAGPAITDNFVLVPLMSSMVEAFRLTEGETQRASIRISSSGNPQIRPTISPSSISWPTEHGFLYVADREDGKVRFRLEARSDLVSHSVYAPPNRLLIASLDGYLFCVDEESGRILWQFSAGESLATAPVAIGDDVYVASKRGGLFAIGLEAGRQKWLTRGIEQVASVTADRIYCQGARGDLVVLDRSSGAKLYSLATSGRERFITNTVSDRIYLATDSGRLICLKEQGATWPSIHVPLAPVEEVAATDQPEKESAAPIPEKEEKTVSDDDIWGAEPDAAPIEDDPFGGSDDDPFGGDPFGDGAF